MTLDELAELLIDSLQAQDWPRALVIAWHGFNQNRQRTVEWAECEWQSNDSDRLEEKLLQGVVSANDLARLLTPHPCLLLSVLDRLANRGHGGRRMLLKEPRLFEHADARFWLVRRATPYRSNGQIADLNKFLPNWSVVAESFDPSSPERRAEVFWSRQLNSSLNGLPESILIYLVEFSKDPIFEPAFCRHWRAQSIVNSEDLAQEALRHIERATEIGADVVIFPELCVPPPVQRALRDYLREREHPHRLIVAGSFHLQDGAEWFNQALALDCDGNEIGDWRHRKMTAVSLKNKVSEGIKRSPVLRIAQTPCGLQAIAICLDLAQALIWEQVPLRELPLAWLWVPSLSKSTNAHQNQAKSCLVAQTTVTACANQRMPGDGKEAAGASFVTAGSFQVLKPSDENDHCQLHRVQWR